MQISVVKTSQTNHENISLLTIHLAYLQQLIEFPTKIGYFRERIEK